MSKSIILVTGTGWNGSTCLMQLLTRLGLDTGWRQDQTLTDNPPHEWTDLDLNSHVPYIVKMPYFSGLILQILEKDFTIDHVVIPFRNLRQVAHSRAAVEQHTGMASLRENIVPGGFWGARDLAAQEVHIMREMHDLFESICEYDLDHTLIHYPRMTEDPLYLYQRLQTPFALSKIHVSESDFLHAFGRTVQPELIRAY